MIEDIENAKKMKDYLFKKSPNPLIGFQKRFFMICDNGTKLAYFDKQNTSEAKGAIEISTINSIAAKGKCRFDILYLGRTFQIKTDSESQRNQWVNALNSLKNSLSSIKDSEKTLPRTETSKKGWKRLENEVKAAIDVERERNISEESKMQMSMENTNALKIKGIHDYLKYLDQGMLEKRIIMGFLGKRSKGKMKYFQKRWCILISAKPIGSVDDEKLMNEKGLPPWMELDTMYYFTLEDENDSSEHKGEVQMKECLEILVKDKENSKEKGFSFKINMGDRLFHLNTELKIEREKWVIALRKSILTSRETKGTGGKGKPIIRKNIDSIVATYDDAPATRKVALLRERMDKDISKIKYSIIPQDTQISSYEELEMVLQGLQTELIDVLNAAKAKDPKRWDITKEYIDYFHEAICSEVKGFWEVQFEIMGNMNILKLASFLNSYSSALSLFCVDDRLVVAQRVLFKTYTTRVLENTEKIIDGILEFEVNGDPTNNEAGLLSSSSPIDLFKIINEGFDLAWGIAPLKEFQNSLASYCKSCINYFIEGAFYLLDEGLLNASQLTAFANNTLKFNSLVKDFSTRICDIFEISDEEEADKLLDLSGILKNFATIGSIAKNKFVSCLYSGLEKTYKTTFLKFDLAKVLSVEVDEKRASIEKFHNSYERKIWKDMLERLLLIYSKFLLIGAQKAGKNDLVVFVKKINEDLEYLTDYFTEILFESVLTSTLSPIQDFNGILNESSLITIQNHCRGLRKFLGGSFNLKTVRVLFKLRGDLEKEEAEDLIDACKEALELYNKEEGAEDKKGPSLDLNEFHLMDDDEEMEFNCNEPVSGNTPGDNRRKSIHFDESDSGSEDGSSHIAKGVESGNAKKEAPKEFTGEGFLLKKPPSGNSWDSRYFRIKNGVLYWYLNERSRTCQNKLKIESIEECMADPASDTKFILVTNTGKDKKKTYRFDASTHEMQNQWIEALLKEMKSCDESQVEEDPQLSISSGKEPLLKDFEAIKRKERKLNNKGGRGFTRTRTEIRQERRSVNKIVVGNEQITKFETSQGPPADGVQGGCCGFFGFFSGKK